MRCCDFCKDKKEVRYTLQYKRVSAFGNEVEGSGNSYEICEYCMNKIKDLLKQLDDEEKK